MPATRTAALLAALAMAAVACTASLDRSTAEQLRQAADAFEPPAPWERPDVTDGPFGDEGFPDLFLVGDDFGTTTNHCSAGEDIRCLQLQRTWELAPDDLDTQTQTAPPLLPTQVEQLRAAVTEAAGWDVVDDPDCVLDQDTAAGRDDGCTWRAVEGDVEVVLRPLRPISTQPWQLELYVHHESFAHDVP